MWRGLEGRRRHRGRQRWVGGRRRQPWRREQRARSMRCGSGCVRACRALTRGASGRSSSRSANRAPRTSLASAHTLIVVRAPNYICTRTRAHTLIYAYAHTYSLAKGSRTYLRSQAELRHIAKAITRMPTGNTGLTRSCADREAKTLASRLRS